MKNMPKKWILAHKRAEQAYRFLQNTQHDLLNYLKKRHINDLYDLHKQYVPMARYQDLQHKYTELKAAVNPQQHEAVIGKAKIQSDHQHPDSSIINQLKKHADDSTASK